MPIYEYRCRKCQKRFSVLTLRVSEKPKPQCDRCGSRRADRLLSRFAMPKSDEARMQSLADPSALSGIDESDPQSVGRWMRKMGKGAGRRWAISKNGGGEDERGGWRRRSKDAETQRTLTELSSSSRPGLAPRRLCGRGIGEPLLRPEPPARGHPWHFTSSNSTTAVAAIASPRPMASTPSLVFALMLTCVKAKTNEGVDAIGRGEAIAATAVVLLEDVKRHG